ncbi:hypothetical protein [Polyangium aurulentum]|uniref:hypothetical protein n=1 Tax=Polyangium aurulentum TaxID=2567896 RepID=UPI0010AE6509|nr:hypothetical protein [Polyangium aurulentum]UQA61873.1 hypothetical protein E8A73_015925 [Polyangium aurulentum]
MRVGIPRDPAQLLALALALAAFLLAPRILRPGKRERLFVGLSALAAALLSAAYVAAYLRGGPRIIDATSYWLEARAIARGHLAFPLDEPTASTLGRFLVRTDGPDGPHAAVIFPPGYPALLALGFLVGAPLLVGPILGAAITVATYALARRVTEDRSSSNELFSIPRLAVLLSVGCAALRYHTADTMSHGLAALLFTAALTFALSCQTALERGQHGRLPALAAGLCAGWLLATRPVSALALALVVALALLGARASLRARIGALGVVAAFALPGLALFVAHQRAATGAFFASSQELYYAVSDGPPGCFRYGFGAGVGCLGEHGDFVRHNLPHGYGAFAATATTLRRLKQHLVDAGNAEPFIALVVLGAALAFRERRARLLALGVLAQIAAYVPFYFDGNYPGGGARFYADVLPLELVLASLAAARLVSRAKEPRKTHALGLLVALVPAGFAFRAGFDHAALRDREGGLPMFEPARIASLPPRSLVFLDTDHGFNLAFDPGPRDRNAWDPKRIDFARLHGDALDRIAWEARGRPPAYRYVFPIGPDGAQRAEVQLLPHSFDLQAPLVIEGESLWPPLAQDRGFALSAYASGTCASAGRWLVIHPAEPGAPARVTVSLPAPPLAGRSIAPRLALTGPATFEVLLHIDDEPARVWPSAPSPDPGVPGVPRCFTLSAQEVPPSARVISMTVVRGPSAPGMSGDVALDRIEVVGHENH